MKRINILVLIITFALIGCVTTQKKDKKQNNKNESVQLIDSHTVKNNLDRNGTYKGFLPCASCPGILTFVRLNNDKTFDKSDFYLESKDGYINDKGIFSFSEKGDKIILKSAKDTILYAVEENKLVLLDKNGDKNNSEFAKMYELNKLSDDEYNFTDTPVKGYLTFGKEVAVFEPCGYSKVYWINDLPDNKLTKLYYNKKAKNKLPEYAPVMSELILKKSKILRQGLNKKHDDVVDVVKIISVELITPDNYCK